MSDGGPGRYEGEDGYTYKGECVVCSGQLIQVYPAIEDARSEKGSEWSRKGLRQHVRWRQQFRDLLGGTHVFLADFSRDLSVCRTFLHEPGYSVFANSAMYYRGSDLPRNACNVIATALFKDHFGYVAGPVLFLSSDQDGLNEGERDELVGILNEVKRRFAVMTPEQIDHEMQPYFENNRSRKEYNWR